MNEDDWLLFSCFAVNWITLIFLVSIAKEKIQNIFINLGIQLLYSSYFWFKLKYNSTGGTAIVAWFFWMVALGIHWFINLIQISIITWKRIKKN